MEIGDWLRQLGLERYETAFRDNEIDAEILPRLTADDLKEMGVAAVGHRRKLLDAIAALAAPSLQTNVKAPAPPRRSSEAERRQLTVMFVDLVGSTQLSGGLDPEDMRQVITAYQNAVAGEISRVDGHVAKFMGDGVLAYFGWPHAHEDDAERAVRAGLAIARAVARLKTPGGAPLSARTGIATGLVVVGDLIGEGAAQEAAIVGDTPNLAARLQSLAEPGAVYIADATRRRLGALFELKDMGVQTLKGIGAAPVFSVLGENIVESRFVAHATSALTPIVGREEELALLRQRWHSVEAGDGQVVVVTGEAGIGKSRLAEAFLESLPRETHTRVRFQCSPYHGDSALYPFISQLSIAGGLRPGDTDERRRAKLAPVLDAAGEGAPEQRTLIEALLGLDVGATLAALNLSPQQQRHRTLAALTEHLHGLSRHAPVLLLVEDAHWIDPTTLELIEASLDMVRANRIMVLITARPTFTYAFGHHPIITRLSLNRLDREQAVRFARHVAGGKDLPQSVLDEITAKSDGVPLYVEEIAKVALESGLLRETGDGFLLDGAPGELSLPSSLHDSLMARLDRLHPVRDIAQIASVLGREFDFRTLAAVAKMPEADLVAALERLSEAELIFRRGAIPEATFTFKHALLRDAAYESMLKARRRALHEAVLRTLEKSGEGAPEIRAHHAQAANLTAPAIDYWRAAGDAALARPAYQEAIGHFANAVALAAAVTETGARDAELELRTKLGLASISARGHSHPATVQIWDDAHALALQTPRADLAFVVAYGLWCAHHVQADAAKARVSARELFDAAERVGEPSHRMMGHRAIAITAFITADFPTSQREHEAAGRLHVPARDSAFIKIVGQDQSVSFRSYYALNLWALGEVELAREMADESIRIAIAAAHANSLGYGLAHAVTLAFADGDLEKAKKLVVQLLACAGEHRLGMWLDFAKRYETNLRLAAGDRDALPDFFARRAALEARHTGLFAAFIDIEGARLMTALGLVSEARALVDGAQARIRVTGECWAEPEAHRVEGLIALASGDRTRAAQCFERAIARADAQSAVSWRRRAQADLRRLGTVKH